MTGYVKANLMPGERIASKAHRSLLTMAQLPSVFLLLSLSSLTALQLSSFLSMILFLVLIAAVQCVRYQTTELALGRYVNPICPDCAFAEDR